jgi:acyl-CoA thioesterase
MRMIDLVPKDPFSTWLGMEYKILEPGVVRTRVELKAHHRNALGAVHGSVIHALADTGMGAAVASLINVGERCATISMTIQYLGQSEGAFLSATSTVIHRGVQVVHLQTDVVDELDSLCARAVATFHISSR